VTFQFDCVFYYVSDLEAAVRFYSGTLGLKLISKDAVARFDLGGVLVELVPGKVERNGNARLCLRVEDINIARSQLEEKGVQVSVAEDKGNGKLAFFRDPDGNEIALWQYAAINR
jgi:catechol 2,3-dioxygenase-like lactoylglutathione lyase family enzyme